MQLDFSKLELKVINTKQNNAPNLYISSNTIGFSKTIAEEMNYPPKVQFCFDEEQKLFVIRSCKENDKKSNYFYKTSQGKIKTYYSTRNKNLVEVLTNLIENFDASLRYKVRGKYNVQYRLMYFDLKEVEVIPSSEFSKS